MGLEKLGNPKLQEQGSQARTTVHDQTSHQLLEIISMELKSIRIILAEMGDISIEGRDMGVTDDY